MVCHQRLELMLSTAIDAIKTREPFVSGLGVGGRRSPDALFPAFCGAYDWHSCVHSLWCLARVLRVFPQAASARLASALLSDRLTDERLEGELATLNSEGFGDFELPYGLAWLARLHGELLRLGFPIPRAMQMLAELAVERLLCWHSALEAPVHVGQHGQSAFALGLLYDYGRDLGACSLLQQVEGEIHRLYVNTTSCSNTLSDEPFGHDFISPSLATMSLVARVMNASRGEFERWFSEFWPDGMSLHPAGGFDAADGVGSHKIGLNLSRAWMLKQLMAALPATSHRRKTLTLMVDAHLQAGLGAFQPQWFASSHWIPTFSVAALTCEGVHSEFA